MQFLLKPASGYTCGQPVITVALSKLSQIITAIAERAMLKTSMPANASLSSYSAVLDMLTRAGVPDDTRWRSLILYFREMKDYTHLSDRQKSELQALLAKTLAEKDFSDQRLSELLAEYHAITVRPFKGKIDDMLREAEGVVALFRELLETRYGNIEDLENFTITTVEEEERSGGSIVDKLRSAFSDIKKLVETDMQELETLANNDALTEIANRRAFDAFLEGAVYKWQNSDTPLSLALFDIDHFKAFNDTHGHRIGDQVLRMVAKQIESRVKILRTAESSVIAARYGGEEFAVAVCGPEAKKLPKLTDAIRKAIGEFNFLIRNTKGEVVENGLQVTVSAGVADCWRGWQGSVQDNLLDSADRALYAAKGAGRNIVMACKSAGEAGFRQVSQK